MNKINLQAQTRQLKGKKVKHLRSDGILPGVIYGKGFDPVSIQVPMDKFEKAYTEAGESTLVYLDLEGNSHPTIINTVKIDPLSSKFTHADFYKVRLDEKIKANIPLVFIGESPAVKNFGGILVKNIHEIEVEGLPQDLPHEVEINISSLVNLEDHISLASIKIPANIELISNPEETIALVQTPMSDEELANSLEGETSTIDDVEVAKKEESAEGEGDGSAESTQEAEKKD